MDELYACFVDEAFCTAALQLEKTDILAYHAWLNGPGTSAPFATLVILHNLVSSSVNGKFLRHGKAHYACVLGAADKLRNTPSSTSKMDFDPEYQVASPNPPEGNLPGIGQHRLIDCSV